MQLIHLGLVMIRIHALHRRNAGTNALVVLRDTRWSDDRSIIGTMEVDLSEGTQLIYIAPNLLISVEDFYHHIELAIQTHGYENWNSAESNLLITRGLIGRLTNTSNAGFRYNIQNVADYLASTGVNAVPATPRTTTELQGMRWILQPPRIISIRNPQAVRTATLLDGSISMAFSGYRSTGNPRPSNYDEKDTEDIQEEFAGVFISFIEEYGAPEQNDRWDTLGEPSGRYNFYVNYAAPPIIPFIPPTKSSWGDEDDEHEQDSEVVFPSIWEDTPWEDDPDFDPNDLAPPEEISEEEEESPESYFLGLQDQEIDYPTLAPPIENLAPPEDLQSQVTQSINDESEAYWQQVIQYAEQIEEQLRPPLENGWYHPYPLENTIIEEFLDRIPQGMPEGIWYEVYETLEHEGTSNEVSIEEATQLSNDLSNININQDPEEQEVAHVNTEQLQQLEYPMLKRLEKALASTSESAISHYKQPNEPLMGQINYPPAQGTTPQFNKEEQYKGRFKGKALEHNTWTLPSAQKNTGAMLVLPEDIDKRFNLLKIFWEKMKKRCGYNGERCMPRNMKNSYKWQEKHKMCYLLLDDSFYWKIHTKARL
ncbi:uncharacterized protein LOC121983038 [Zingiber officinale]|uniref:uncharacterized protein LOC121983038 n=1 Tax=Zingiber officinale TaxID=94328 RepID=UPI001C4C875F|nr:uncharacterized protein LOC121983038 [Zingiber officinale]